VDVFVGFSSSAPNRLFVNDGSGHFTDGASIAGIIKPGHSSSLGSDWGDFDNDGLFDLFVARADNRPNRLFRNEGDGTFTEIAENLGIADSLFARDGRWFDYDNDGALDLFIGNYEFETSQLFLNDGNVGFVTTSRPALIPYPNPTNRARLAFADYDNDGDLDLFLGDRFYRNNNASGNNWIHVRTVGTVSNRAGIGAQVRVFAGKLKQIRQVTAGTGKTQNSLPVEFGLGAHSLVDSLFVRWPSGNIDTLTNVKSNQIVTIMEGNGIVSGIKDQDMEPTFPHQFALEQNFPNPFNPRTVIPFQVAKEGFVTLSIYNVLGQKIITLVNGWRQSGRYQVEWSGKSEQGSQATTGIYVYRLEADGLTNTKRMVFLK
jgi:hypothetical protein